MGILEPVDLSSSVERVMTSASTGFFRTTMSDLAVKAELSGSEKRVGGFSIVATMANLPEEDCHVH